MSEHYLSKIYLKNFRNIDEVTISFSQKINCLFGNNGNGKTNLLEAIYYIANKKSFRKNATFPQMLSLDGEKPEIIFSVVFQNNEKIHSYSGKVNQLGISTYLDQEKFSKKPPLQVIIINPFDSFLFFNTSSQRRSWFDEHLSLMESEFRTNFSKFNKALKFRNALLLQGKNAATLQQIKIIDKQIADYGSVIMLKRAEFCKSLNELVVPTFKRIFDEKMDLKIKYEPKINQPTPEAIFEYMQKDVLRDFEVRSTKRGIHLDEYEFYLSGAKSTDYSSVGQQKMSYLSLFFSFLELTYENNGHYPVVLIDDISGELDSLRWKNLIQYLEQKNFQVLITTANTDFENELKKLQNVAKLNIVEGRISTLQ
jgi:DNA replication and repair protein RecF